ncbi:chymotrypsin-2 [Asbolus verrucosus]|uniref:Chymotrypsin-2 n=1 Tax=Asbolus verrucosus TaxID=1661398 RepID=A0A482VEM8_ASBVE|nr:chymotrypsin-2 [Asbolus verrucosus]
MKPILETATLLSLAVSALALPTKDFDLKIFGGNTAKPGQFPSIVSMELQLFLQSWCSGSIINKNWFVTAAGCVTNMFNEDIYIKAGTVSLNEGGLKYNVSNITIHPTFNDTTYTDDIALVKIDGEFTFTDFLQPIEIGEVAVNQSCTVAGWGQTEQTNIPSELSFAEVRALSEDECDKLAEDGIAELERGPGQICGYKSSGVGACFGDAGGPMIADGRLVGIASYSITPCAQGWPDVYTRVAYYTEWINEIVN